VKHPVLAIETLAVIAGLGVLGNIYSNECPFRLGVYQFANAPTVSTLVEKGYALATTSDASAVYVNSYGQQLFITTGEEGEITSICADTLLSEESNMSVSYSIKLGDDEDRVVKWYGEPVMDLGNGKLYARDSISPYKGRVYVGTLDGKVIHVEVTYEDE
jgi:hypothetical protein